MKSLFDFQLEYSMGAYEQYQKYLRIHFASMAMQGLLANPQCLKVCKEVGMIDKADEFYSVVAVEHADALIAELNKPVQP